MDVNLRANGCTKATCRKCSQQFELLPTQLVHPNCVPSLCPLCRGGAKPCARCGQMFVRRGVGHPTKFCSPECRDLHRSDYYERHAEEARAPKYEKTCEDCGVGFTTAHAKAIRCSQCRMQMRLTGKTERTCERCGERFRATKARQCQACRKYADQQRNHQASALRWKKQQRQVSICRTAAVGGIAERMFDIACLSRGWVLLEPVSDGNPGFDRVIVRGTEFTRVQVKGLSGHRFSDGKQWELGGGFERLNLESFDELAVVDVDSGFMWLIPKSQIQRKFHPTDYAEYETHALGLTLNTSQ